MDSVNTWFLTCQLLNGKYYLPDHFQWVWKDIYLLLKQSNHHLLLFFQYSSLLHNLELCPIIEQNQHGLFSFNYIIKILIEFFMSQNILLLFMILFMLYFWRFVQKYVVFLKVRSKIYLNFFSYLKRIFCTYPPA